MAYEVTTFDVCASGFERLRSQDEFILLASIDAATDGDSLLEQWLSDIQSCERFDGFDYDAARAAVNEYWNANVRPLFAARQNPFNLDEGRSDIGMDDGDECCNAFLFIRHD